MTGKETVREVLLEKGSVWDARNLLVRLRERGVPVYDVIGKEGAILRVAGREVSDHTRLLYQVLVEMFWDEDEPGPRRRGWVWPRTRWGR